jgi:cathepsin B
MKILIVFLLIITIINCDYLVNDQSIINAVNEANAGWTAGRNSIFNGKTLSQVKKMLGALLVQPISEQVYRINVAEGFAPASFDSREKWPSCVHTIRNQGQCGSCWAFAGSEVLSDRFCVASAGSINHVLSPQDMVSCDKGDLGCQGGYLDREWNYLVSTGIVTDACFPYVSGGGQVPKCPFDTAKKCVAGSTEEFKKYQAAKSYHYANVDSIMADMMEKGPIMAGFKVYQDFFNYKSGVYKHVTGSFAGGHAIKIIGWGVDAATKQNYWIIANSWGESWGMKGYFWMLKDKNECEIETQMYAGDPLDE